MNADLLMRNVKDHSRFWAKVDVRGVDDCWIWRAVKTPGGYGQFFLSGRGKQYAHRVVYSNFVKGIPLGMEIDHLCRTKSCVNPRHLDVVTRAENNRRSDSASSVNATKTHCGQGHPFDDDNTYVWKGVERHCRLCHAARERMRRHRHRELHRRDQAVSA